MKREIPIKSELLISVLQVKRKQRKGPGYLLGVTYLDYQ